MYVYAQFTSHSRGSSPPAEDMPPTYSYKLTQNLTYDPSHATTLAIIKRGPILDPTSPLATQLHILNLFGSDETPYESLHAVISCAMKPYFEAFVGARGGGKDGGDSKMGAPVYLRDACIASSHYFPRHPRRQEEIR